MTLEEKRSAGRPKAHYVQDQLDLAKKTVDEFDDSIKSMTMDRMNQAPIEEKPPQVERSQKDLDKCKDIYLKPQFNLGGGEKFNEKFRDRYEYDKVYVKFEAQNYEIIGEPIEIWTKPYAGVPAQFWKVPTNVPVYGPRFLAEQIKRKRYHRLIMKETQTTGQDNKGQYYGAMAAESTLQRLDAKPVSEERSFFMGARNF